MFSKGDVGTGIDNITYSGSIPEPASLAVWSICLAGVGFVAWRRKRKAA
ncbi:MAG: PEP-CTERM sorting domain-containing protein [Pirellulaceae bacterium]